MSQTVSITEARDNLPALLRQVNATDEAVVVTNRSKPHAVILRWESYQKQQHLQVPGAKYHLNELVTRMAQIVAVLLEAYQPDSYDLINGQEELQRLTDEAWTTCSLLDKPRRLLASLLSDGFLNLRNRDARLSLEQLTKLNEIVPLLHSADLTMSDVAQADRALAEVGFDSVIPYGDELVKHYFPVKGEDV